MGRAIVAAQPGAIHAKRDVEVLQRDVMNDHVVSALHEGRVDRQKRLQSLRRQTAGEERGVFLRDPDIEVRVGMLRLEKTEAGSAGHRGGDRDDLLVRVGKFRQRLADNLGIGRVWRRRRFAGLELEFPEAMKLVRLRDGRLIAFAFFGQNVKQDRLVLGLEKLEGADEQRNVVTIDRTVIAKTEFLENDARQEQIFDALFDLVREIATRSCPRSP